MRGGRSFLVLVIVALGLGAYIYFVESRREPADTIEKKDKVFAVEADKIEELELRAASGEVTSVRKSGGDWQIVAPAKLDVDTAEVRTLVTSLETLEIQRVLDENPASVAPFGLEPPRFSVGVRLAGETAMRRLQVGNKTPTGADLYARIEGQPRVVLISSYVEESLNRTPFSLRDKSVLKITRDGIDSVALEIPGSQSMSFARKGNLWRFTRPIETKADANAIDGILSRITTGRMKEIVVDASGAPTGLAPADLKKHGLEKPEAVATLGAGSTRATLAIGGKKDDTTLYARDLSRPLIFTVESTLLEELKKKPDDLRVKDVFEFRAFNAVSLATTLAGQTLQLEKQKNAQADQSSAAETWKRTKPTAKDVDQTKVSDLLAALSNLRADSFTDKPFASGEELVVVARFGEAAAPTEERATLRKSGAVVHAIRAGETGAAVVPTADFDKAVGLLKELAAAK